MNTIDILDLPVSFISITSFAFAVRSGEKVRGVNATRLSCATNEMQILGK